MTATIGIDPGSRTTAIILIDNKQKPVKLSLVKNDGELLPVPADYIQGAINELRDYVTQNPDATIAVEGITRPNWHLATEHKRGSAANPTGLLGTAMLLGAIISHYPDAVIIPPNKNGSKPLVAYPDELISPHEKKHPDWKTRVGTGKLRHARSAYDVAVAAR